jgi:esterase/lipase superfamily enzyme
MARVHGRGVWRLSSTLLLVVAACWGCAKREAERSETAPTAKPAAATVAQAESREQPQAAAEAARAADREAERAAEQRQQREMAATQEKAEVDNAQPMASTRQPGPAAAPPVVELPRVNAAAEQPAAPQDSSVGRSLGEAAEGIAVKTRGSRAVRPLAAPAASSPSRKFPDLDQTLNRLAREVPPQRSKPAASPTPDIAPGAGDSMLKFRESESAADNVPQMPAAAPVIMPAPPPPPAPARVAVAPVMPSPAPPAAAATVLAAEPAPVPPSAASTTPAKPTKPAARDPRSDQFTVVQVHYGTDRAPVDESIPGGFSAASWYWFTSSVAGLTIALALACWRFPNSRVLRWSSACGLIATVGLGLATIRARHDPQSSDPTVRRLYSNRRGSLEFGVCEVSIPKEHTAGVVERPSLLKLEFSENPLKHVVLESVRLQTPDEFHASLKTRVDASFRKEALVFVHGFNVSFESAARRTAQIAYDLKFDGAPIFFSWPSHGGLLGYTIDETNVVWTVPHLKQFLVDVAQRSGARCVHLVAHSMGNRALTSALRELYYELNKDCPRFGEVVLTAPDIDADVFRRDLAPAIVRTAGRVTLYASSNDEALVLSKKVHGYPRAGDSGAELIVLPGMDTIDVSAVDTSLLGHSYYGNNLTVLADLFDLLHEAKPAESRPWLAPMQAGTLRYWMFKRIQEAALGRERL